MDNIKLIEQKTIIKLNIHITGLNKEIYIEYNNNNIIIIIIIIMI